MFYYSETDIRSDSGSKLMFYYNETDIRDGSGSKLMFYYNECWVSGDSGSKFCLMMPRLSKDIQPYGWYHSRLQITRSDIGHQSISTVDCQPSECSWGFVQVHLSPPGTNTLYFLEYSPVHELEAIWKLLKYVVNLEI